MKKVESAVQFCPVEVSLGLITKKWTIQIVKDMFFGKTKFKEFKENRDITNKILSKRLKELEESGIIKRVENPDNVNDIDYYLTKRGKALKYTVYDLAMYVLDNDEHYEDYTEEEKENVRNEFKKRLEIE